MIDRAVDKTLNNKDFMKFAENKKRWGEWTEKILKDNNFYIFSEISDRVGGNTLHHNTASSSWAQVIDIYKYQGIREIDFNRDIFIKLGKNQCKNLKYLFSEAIKSSEHLSSTYCIL